MNAARDRIFLTFLGLAIATTVAGCANGILGSEASTRTQGIEPRVATLETCPKAGNGFRSESGLPAALVSALVPAIIDTGVTAFEGVLHDAAEDSTTTVTARTASQFYSSSSVLEGGSEPFNIQNNRANGCLVLAYGPMWSNTPSAEFTGVYFSSTEQNDLITGVGLQGNPYFYYEGRFIYSLDQSAFRIEERDYKI